MAIRVIFVAMLCALSWAQDTSAPVLIDGKEVARIYGPLGTFSAKDRAATIEGRIIALAEKGFAGKLVIRQRPSEQATAVLAGPVMVMTVTDSDAEIADSPERNSPDVSLSLSRRRSRAIAPAIPGGVSCWHSARLWLSGPYSSSRSGHF